MIRKPAFNAVIFDMDGVITDTNRVHAAAWKAVFDEYLGRRGSAGSFSAEDYFKYVDGRPRLEGAKSFLLSRGVEMPVGEADDKPGAETLFGLANLKNEKFYELIGPGGPRLFPSTMKVIKALRKKNVKMGIASLSRNCSSLLEDAGIMDNFGAVIDGLSAEKNGLKTKPEPDTFLMAASMLGVAPAKTAAVDDTVQGVRAARDGAFGMVVGVSRENNSEELFKSGADVVVDDLSAIDVKFLDDWFRRKPRYLFSSWDAGRPAAVKRGPGNTVLKINPSYSLSGSASVFNGRKIFLFLDFDGTLTPVTNRPDLASLSGEMKDALRALAAKFTTTVISGRSLEELKSLVRVKGLFYAGNHGFEIEGPGVSMTYPGIDAITPLIREVTGDIFRKLSSVKGILIQEKIISSSVHYKLAAAHKISFVEKTVRDAVRGKKGIRLLGGKKVIEILPDIDWHKGKAVAWIVEKLGFTLEKVSAVYAGDDLTDENAFRTLRTRGTGILVSEKSAFSAADFYVRNTADVKRLIDTLLARGS